MRGTLLKFYLVDTRYNLRRKITTLAAASVDRDFVRVPRAKLCFALAPREKPLSRFFVWATRVAS